MPTVIVSIRREVTPTYKARAKAKQHRKAKRAQQRHMTKLAA